MKYSGIILASAVLAIGLSAGSPVADAKVITSYAPAKIAGPATCAAKYPAGRGQRAAFPHQLTGNCYSCPTGYARSLNPNIGAGNACQKVVAAKALWSKATYRGNRRVEKPREAFFDPRKGGEWWRCPEDRPRRTAYAVTHKYACATRSLWPDEKLARAKFVSKAVRGAPKGAFFDPRKGGEYWSCPKGYSRTVAYPVNHKSRACKKAIGGKTYNARAKSRGPWGCKTGTFRNGPGTTCYVCPASYRRSDVPGVDLHKVKRACVKTTVRYAGDAASAGGRPPSAASDYFSFACKAEIAPRDRMDGCSDPIQTKVNAHYRSLFRPACDNHDVCYSSPWRKAGFNDINGQTICDKALHDEAIAICDRTRFKGGATEKHACLAAARAYLVGVGVGATVLRAYQNGQKWIADKQCSVKRR